MYYKLKYDFEEYLCVKEPAVAKCSGDKIMTAYQNIDCDSKTVLSSTFQKFIARMSMSRR